MKFKGIFNHYEEAGQGSILKHALRSGLAYCLFAAVLGGAVIVAPDYFFGFAVTALWLLAMVAAFFFVFPSRWMAVIAPLLVLGTWWGLSHAATEKMDLTDFPLMALDVKMFVADPQGLLVSIGSPKFFYVLLNLLPWILGAGCFYLGFQYFGKHSLGSAAKFSLLYLAKLAIVAAGFMVLYNSTAISMNRFIKAHDSEFGVWSGDGLTKFARYVGVVPFILYSYSIESDGTKNFLTYQPQISPPSSAEVLTSTSKYLDFSIIKPRLLPNILVIHAESTFDPNDVFNLAAPVNGEFFYSTPLPRPDSTVHFRGPGLANIIGGGSWVSEFEIVNGIDSRLFGVAGRYTHASLSSYSHNSLATYLAGRGYHSSVSTPDSALFYNAGVAYKRYGFERFHGQTGDPQNDVATMSAALAQDGDFVSSDRPFLKLVMLQHNHSPHPCSDAFKSDYGTASFVLPASDAETCALREFVRRSQDTEQAIANAKAFLQSQEKLTGRPYVIAIYGDHQPYSFTGDGPVSFNLGLVFDRFRKDTEKRKTVIEIISSAENPFLVPFSNPIPFSLVSTMISAYVATAPDQLYLPENFYQFDQCGSDMIGRLTTGDFYGHKDGASKGLCKSFDKVVSALKKSDVLGDKPPQEVVLASVAPVINPPDPAFHCPVKTIRIAAAGSYFEGGPEVSMLVDGKDIGHAVLKDDHSTQAKAPLEMEKNPDTPLQDFNLPENTSPRQIAIRFLNDHWGSAAEDRNVNIHGVMLDGQPLDTTHVSFSPPDAGWVNSHGVIQLFQTGSVIFSGPFPIACH